MIIKTSPYILPVKYKYSIVSFRTLPSVVSPTSYQRIREVEHASFTPIIMSATGEGGDWLMKPQFFYKHLASLLLAKWSNEDSVA